MEEQLIHEYENFLHIVMLSIFVSAISRCSALPPKVTQAISSLTLPYYPFHPLLRPASSLYHFSSDINNERIEASKS